MAADYQYLSSNAGSIGTDGITSQPDSGPHNVPLTLGSSMTNVVSAFGRAVLQYTNIGDDVFSTTGVAITFPVVVFFAVNVASTGSAAVVLTFNDGVTSSQAQFVVTSGEIGAILTDALGSRFVLQGLVLTAGIWQVGAVQIINNGDGTYTANLYKPDGSATASGTGVMAFTSPTTHLVGVGDSGPDTSFQQDVEIWFQALTEAQILARLGVMANALPPNEGGGLGDLIGHVPVIMGGGIL
jgi:hypothetical protein